MFLCLKFFVFHELNCIFVKWFSNIVSIKYVFYYCVIIVVIIIIIIVVVVIFIIIIIIIIIIIKAKLFSEGGKSIALGDYTTTWRLHRKLAMKALRYL